jgi:hypothetical protein
MPNRQCEKEGIVDGRSLLTPTLMRESTPKRRRSTSEAVREVDGWWKRRYIEICGATLDIQSKRQRAALDQRWGQPSWLGVRVQ